MFNSETTLWEIRRLAEAIFYERGEWSRGTNRDRLEMAKHLAGLVFDLDRDLTNGVAELPKDWRPKDGR